MSSTVYALLIMALLNGRPPVDQPDETTLARLPGGSAGKVGLVLRLDDRLDRPRAQGMGLVGDDHAGRLLRVERGWRGDNRLSAGLRREF